MSKKLFFVTLVLAISASLTACSEPKVVEVTRVVTETKVVTATPIPAASEASDVEEAAGNMSESVQGLTNLMEAVATTAPSDEETTEPLYEVSVSNSSMFSLVGSDAFRIEFTLVESPNGVSYQHAQIEAGNKVHEIRETCLDGKRRDYSIYWNREIYSQGGEELGQDCIDLLSGYSDPIKFIPNEAITQLKQMASIGDRTTLFISDNHFIGYWNGTMEGIDLNSDCFLEALGVDEYSQVFAVDRDNGPIWDILYQYGLFNWHGQGRYGGRIPNFCGDASLVEIEKPSWVTVTNYISDEINFIIENESGVTANFSIHSDSSECNIYERWPNDRFLVEIVSEDEDGNIAGSPFVTLSPGDLIHVAQHWSDDEFVYLTLDDEGNLTWLAPTETSEWNIATISVIPTVDGITPFWSFPQTSSYKFNDEIINQTEVEYFD